jgi:hypothetical protein
MDQVSVLQELASLMKIIDEIADLLESYESASDAKLYGVHPLLQQRDELSEFNIVPLMDDQILTRCSKVLLPVETFCLALLLLGYLGINRTTFIRILAEIRDL